MNNDLYVQKAQAKLNEYQAIIQEYKEKAKLKAIQSKIELSNQLDGAQGSLDAAKQQLSGLAESAQDKSKEMISDVGVAVDNLAEKFNKLISGDDDVTHH